MVGKKTRSILVQISEPEMSTNFAKTYKKIKSRPKSSSNTKLKLQETKDGE